MFVMAQVEIIDGANWPLSLEAIGISNRRRQTDKTIYIYTVF